MFIVSHLVPMCWDPKEPHCCQPSVCIADLLASLFVLLCQIYSSVGDCGAFHNEGCNLNFTWCWVLWVQPVCWSFFVGEAGGIIRVPRNWRFFNWIAMSKSLWSWWRETHTSHISPDLFLGWSECLPSFVYSLRYQIWIFMDMFGIAKATTTTTLLLKEWVLNLKSCVPVIWNFWFILDNLLWFGTYLLFGIGNLPVTARDSFSDV